VDLDGTLLGLDIDRFLPVYLQRLAAFVGEAVRLPDFSQRFMAAVGAMVAPRSDGRTNEEAFYATFRAGLAPAVAQACDDAFAAFYQRVFPSLRDETRPMPGARSFAAAAARRGFRLILATSPVFPRFVIEERLRWAGMGPDLFEAITSFETSRHNKPDRRYYEEVLSDGGISPAQALMIGNDLRDDGAATLAGIEFAFVEGRYARLKEPIGTPVWHGSMRALAQAVEGGEPPFAD
jgi:FMN phosphatase YigB (HAD superfamily)